MQTIRMLGLILIWLGTFAGTLSWDPGLTRRCAWSARSGDERRFYADYTDCSDVRNFHPYPPHDIPHYIIGTNALTPGHHHCGRLGQAFRVNGRGSPVGIRWKRENGAYAVSMAIRGNSCASNGEVAFAFFEYNALPVVGLITSNEIRIRSRRGISHANLELYMHDENGNQYDLTLTLRPNTDDTNYNRPRPGVLFRGRPMQDHHQIVLDAGYFGYPDVCVGRKCPWTNIVVDWESLFDFVKSEGWWPDLHKDGLVGHFAIGNQTLKSGARISLEHRSWLAWNHSP